MKPKTKALIFNLIAFAILFLIFRIAVGYVLKLETFWLALIAAVIASILAPKFIVVEENGKEKLLMKTVFSKDIREL
ncbi:hypothetical protein KORDIASMS9_04387 [Kordia sp. SMS9]|uniref:hypothetical protein n=1 Tax=Kordia sp. SMS9 TaxID=2282170 RepID=UPI000E0D8F7B|nr:hypothetical protein [Kordia sp. SMS9]AXG72124.1 hypothetical protein KORDIASMS9_04387 [Kordia sp. SMS9]